MTYTFLDPCLFYKKFKNGLEGIQLVQFDDVFRGGTNDFISLEAAKSIFNCEEPEESLTMKFKEL